MHTTKNILICVLFAVLIGGCGDDSGSGGSGAGATGTGGSGGGSGGAGGSGGGDNGSPSTTYPAFMPDMPSIVANNGTILANMKIATVTYAGDPHATDFETFGDAIGATQYWHTLNSEYGVGPATSGANYHVHVSGTPPMTLTGSGVAQLVSSNANGSGAGWPQADGETLYVVYISPMTTFTQGGQPICNSGVGAYHSSVGGIPYAVMPQCPTTGYLDVIQFASHEMNEAATDPQPGSGYVGIDNDHQAWEVYLVGQDEVGDACEFKFRAFYTDMEANFNYAVQRQWSNASAHAGHNPCVPVENKPYYNVTLFPNQLDTITANLGYLRRGTVQTKGVKIPMGQSKTIQVGFFSDAAVNMPWTLTADVPANLPNLGGTTTTNGTAMVTVDKTSGVNGEKANVTITPMSYGAAGFLYIEFQSKEPGLEGNSMPLLVAPN